MKKKVEKQQLSRQQRLALEKGSYLKKWSDRNPVALIYPNTYEVGMSSLGFQLVYNLLGERNDTVCERFFLPDKNVSFLSLESGRSLLDFPIIFLSVSFEHDYINVVRTLLLGGIEPTSRGRRESGREPLVICGGVATFMNPEPIAPFVDLFVIGEAEPILNSLVDYIYQSSHLERSKLLLEVVKRFDGLYCPEFYTPVYGREGQQVQFDIHPDVPERITRLYIEDCRKSGHSEILTPEAEFSDLYLTELGRGCSRGCRFCAAGFIYRPPRIWDSEAILSALDEKNLDINRVGLLGMEMAGDQTLNSISQYLLESGCALSFSSLRADRINDNLLKLLSNSELKSVAIAPDGASERLRRVINKGLDEESILNAAEKLVTANIYKLKLYIMVGLPTEKIEDLQELIELIQKIKDVIDPIGKKRGRLSEIYLSVNCFVPKPWTPFQFHPFGLPDKLEEGEERGIKECLQMLKRKITYLKSGVKNISNVHFQSDKPENGLFQSVLSRGDRRLAQVICDVAAKQIPWKNSMKRNNLRPEWFISTGTSVAKFFPWYIIDHRISRKYLYKEYEKAFTSSLTEPCDVTICRRCGVCFEGKKG